MYVISVVSSQFQDILPITNVSSLVCASTAKALTSKAFAASAIKGGYNAYTYDSSTGKCNIGRMPPFIYYNTQPRHGNDGLMVDKCMPNCKILNSNVTILKQNYNRKFPFSPYNI